MEAEFEAATAIPWKRIVKASRAAQLGDKYFANRSSFVRVALLRVMALLALFYFGGLGLPVPNRMGLFVLHRRNEYAT
jgi:hypothetical protein